MNILPINNLGIHSFKEKNKQLNYTSSFGLTMAKPLLNDTVSFKSRTIGSQVEAATVKKVENLGEEVIVFLDSLESIANKGADRGLSFNRAYCEKHPIKSIEAYLSKIARSGSFDVRDLMRATLYSKNPYDLTTLNDFILPELKLRGYELASLDVPVEEARKMGFNPKPSQIKKGYTKIPDLDIRLGDLKPEDIEKLSPELQHCISKPQKSGYEDIQLRLKKGKSLYELIILFGKNYSEAKEIESRDIYSHLRRFDEMHIFNKHKDPANRNISLIERYSDLAKKMIRTQFSEKLFENAKNKDVYDLVDEIPINLKMQDRAILVNYFIDMEERLNNFYRDKLKEVGQNIKLKQELTKDFEQDKKILKEIRLGLRQTINEFNSKNPPKS